MNLTEPKWTSLNLKEPKWSPANPYEPHWNHRTPFNTKKAQWTKLNKSKPHWTHRTPFKTLGFNFRGIEPRNLNRARKTGSRTTTHGLFRPRDKLEKPTQNIPLTPASKILKKGPKKPKITLGFDFRAIKPQNLNRAGKTGSRNTKHDLFRPRDNPETPTQNSPPPPKPHNQKSLLVANIEILARCC